MKRFIKAIFLFLIAVGVAAFAVANRHSVKFILDPFDPYLDQNATASVQAPFFVFLFAAFGIGICVGACVMWLGQAHWRSKAQLQGKEAALWKREAENLKQGIAVMTSGQQSQSTQAKGLRSYI